MRSRTFRIDVCREDSYALILFNDEALILYNDEALILYNDATLFRHKHEK